MPELLTHPRPLSRRPGPTPADLPLLGDLTLRRGRLHEACGPARRTLALWLAAQTEGPVLWIAPEWQIDRLHPQGIQHLLNPGRLIFVHPKRPEDVLWTMEEVLRSGAVELAIADIPGPPGLTQVRRMHLAAETGAAEGRCIPTGILLTPQDGGAQGIESRWYLAATHSPDSNLWLLERRRARTAPQHSWTLQGAGPPGSPPIHPKLLSA